MYFWIYSRSLWIVWCAIITLPVLWALFARRINISILRLIWVIYVLIIFSVTVFNRQTNEHTVILVPFYSFVLAKQQAEVYRELSMNVLLFVPFGMLSVFAFHRNNALKSIVSAATLSLLIETIQYCFGLGTAELDDVITNTLGTVIGTSSFWISRLFNNSFPEQQNMIKKVD